MGQKTHPRLCPNQAYDRHQNIIFLNLEAFTHYWSHFTPAIEDIKPLVMPWEVDKDTCQKLSSKKKLYTEMALD